MYNWIAKYSFIQWVFKLYEKLPFIITNYHLSLIRNVECPIIIIFIFIIIIT